MPKTEGPDSAATILRDDDRRLNLEQQKTRAKELCHAIRRGEADAIARLLRHHPDARDVDAGDVPARFARLGDAQLVIARELGLPSWPKLRAHVERMQRARDAIAGKAAAPDADARTAHLRCGSDIRNTLRESGFVGDFLEVADPLCFGPVPRADDYRAIRARFIAGWSGMTPAEVEAKLAREDDALAQAAHRYDRLVLWYEHDSYDQLSLARVLAEFSGRARRPLLELICVDRFPAITRFNGLGQLSPTALRALWESRAAVTAAQLRLGAAIWDALREPSPMALHAIAAGGTKELRLMAAALWRHLQELPWTGDGLSLTQRLALQALRDGPRTVSQLFRVTQLEIEPLPFMGDLMFWAVLREMASVASPPVMIDAATADRRWPDRVLSLTPIGERLLAGTLDWLGLDPPERWLGGIRIAPGAPAWRWDEATATPTRP